MIKEMRHRQPFGNLFVEVTKALSGSVLSPYHPDSRAIKNSVMAVNKAVVRDIEDGGGNNYNVTFSLLDSSGSVTVNNGLATFDSANITSWQSYIAAAETAIDGYATAHGYTLSAGITWSSPSVADINTLIAAALPPAPTSYQTIVSQSTTAAPAVSGGFTPMSTYAGGVTFTWARTGTGVYTLTANSAVFNTSKTGVFVAPLQNLNGSVRAVVTSTTVVTVTTAVQSLAVLGLLGFTATPTDGLLSGTMIYVQTYA